MIFSSRSANSRLFLVFFVLFLPSMVIALNALDRDSDPVILSGSDLPDLLGVSPGQVVAFKYEAGWIQVPVQIDERAVVDFGAVYNESPIGITTWTYTDTSTFAGADPDTTFDADDELVFMAKDAGNQVPPATIDPPGVVGGSRHEVMVSNPLSGMHAFIYIFQTDGSLSPGAGADYVNYNFNLLSGHYKTTYSFMSGPNPENSEATTSYYRTHFSDRWIRDEVNVHAGASTGADILDRHKNLFSPGNCARSENTFSGGEGAFFINKDGPVRAIRSYMGANSGPLTQREHIFYERRQDIRTFLRVHAISGVMDFYDYSPAASGLTYCNDINLSGVTIDGFPDVVTKGAIVWEMVTGPQGTLVIAHDMDTDIPGFAYTSYYADDSTTSVTQCTGDDFEYGSSGPWIDQSIPNTDPYMSPYYKLISDRIVYYEGPNQTISLAELLYDQATNPPTISVSTAVAKISVPHSFELSRNFPNPFSNETTIQFTLPEASEVSLRIYDVTGRLVKTLLEGMAGKGTTPIVWNRTNTNGRRVPCGVYFYRLESNTRLATRKLVVID
ncbi:MAG: T9SS type A sorting domain-containing protein [Candidatus Latescibacteria bacterium]|nr:T9SS type A sorting domain-containing protein [Candidatus Latescibacterota bacterium]NIO00987.1 T9SS type A sorting domain-containing protein [Candidatus Latescibacterota bacterium]NIO27386.1 T9SS type A sorting domain-containing protein [Candidatus Latescibacterota bacterium]NIO54908.1 T9SS type A sorting domain-containing protein [Candidatus Latescibacterota bacterium]NIT00997.1 T9SS type A sorting domain-containing protein [Candidatus Latescibacterota bacterium]